MIGMNDDTRYLSENRHGQLLAEAETRRLADGETERTGIAGAMHRLGQRLFGARESQAEMVVSDVELAADTLPAPVAMAAAARATSAGEPCSGTHVHGQVAA
jgi:hypothetical protein